MPTHNRQITVYLAGGFSSGWQKFASQTLNQCRVLDPSTHNLQDSTKYTHWDLDAIRHSDVILANIEESNPGGYSLALEVGFAHALNKYIILNDQLRDPVRKKYFEMVRQCSDAVFSSLEEAVQHAAQIAGVSACP